MLIRPGYEWEGHQAGQYLRIGLDINGRRHWRAYSLTSDPGRPDGFISITIKNVDEGVVSPYLVRRGRPGSIVSLGGVEGEFVLPDPLPEKLLFISAGSGITPIMSMLRSLEHQDALDDVLLIHSARTPDDVIFGEQLRAMEERNPGFRLHEQLHGRDGPLQARRPRAAVPRLARARGVHLRAGRAARRARRALGRARRLRPPAHGALPADHRRGRGGRGRDDQVPQERLPGAFATAASRSSWPARTPASSLPFGCREGICHTCVGELKSGEIRDLRTGKVSGQRGEMVRTCINAPEGPVEIEL